MRLPAVLLLVCGCASTVEPAPGLADAGLEMSPQAEQCLLARDRLLEVGCGALEDDAAWLDTCLGWLGGLDTECIIEADDCLEANRCAN